MRRTSPPSHGRGRPPSLIVLLHRSQRFREVWWIIRHLVPRIASSTNTAAVVMHIHGPSVFWMRMRVMLRLVVWRLRQARAVCHKRLHARESSSTSSRLPKTSSCTASTRWKALARTRNSTERRRRCARRGNEAAAALVTPTWIAALAHGCCCPRSRPALAASARLVLVLWKLTLVAGLLLVGESLPIVLGLLVLLAPVLADDLGDFRVGESWVDGDDAGLVMLTVENESCDG